MNNLPSTPLLPIECLSASFDKVTNSYKFFWFLAILDHLRTEKSRIIPINDLLSRMLASVWFPTNYFRLSFGKQDQLAELALQLGRVTDLGVNSRQAEVYSLARQQLMLNTELSRRLQNLGNYVPFRFLRPFFTETTRGLRDTYVNKTILELSQHAYNDPYRPCLYRFINNPFNSIEIHPAWHEYLMQHLSIVEDFCLWNLICYLQKHNPNVPNIAGKLFEPEHRNLTRARSFWRLVFSSQSNLTCIYSNEILKFEEITLDHFLPWRFTAHDLLWNIIPTSREINSSKSDNLPDLNLYFNPFANLQYTAVQAVAVANQPSLLEDYLLIFNVGSIEELASIPQIEFTQQLHSTFAPQFQIAANMGFSINWRLH